MRLKLGIPLTLGKLAEFFDAEIRCASALTVTHITTDSREALAGDLFIALLGTKLSGEDFIGDAKTRGAFTLGTADDADLCSKNINISLCQFITAYKSLLKNLKYTVAITGSVGKTTTKEFLLSAASTLGVAHGTHQNYNNLLGAFITMATAPRDVEFLVFEIGMNHAGEIEEISKSIQPNFAVITNVSVCHIENLLSIENIAKAKLEIKAGLKSGPLLCPKNDPKLSEAASLTFSVNENSADYSLFSVGNFLHFYVKGIDTLTFGSRFFARHHVSAICIALGFVSHVTKERAALERAAVRINETVLRQNFISIRHFKIFDDTYSSSPDAVIADLEFLGHLDGVKSCALGDMLELGSYAEAMHRKIGTAAARHGIDKLFLFGKFAKHTEAGAIEGGIPPSKIFINTEISAPEITAKQIWQTASENETVLIKASHSLNAYKIIEILERMNKNAR